jgi:hypothetical protein
MAEFNKREPSRETKRRAALDMWRPGDFKCPGDLEANNILYEREFEFESWFKPVAGAGNSSLASGSLMNKNSSLMSFKMSNSSKATF